MVSVVGDQQTEGVRNCRDLETLITGHNGCNAEKNLNRKTHVHSVLDNGVEY